MLLSFFDKDHILLEGQKFCKISTLYLTVLHTVKSKMEISQNFVTFSEYMNFIVAGSERYGVLATVALELVVVLCYCLARLLFGREP